MAINQTKDEVVLDLKRQIDQLSLELDSFRNKGQELHQQLSEKREALQRTVKALRLRSHYVRRVGKLHQRNRVN